LGKAFGRCPRPLGGSLRGDFDRQRLKEELCRGGNVFQPLDHGGRRVAVQEKQLGPECRTENQRAQAALTVMF
jgi:hypothetical protein